MFVSVARLTLQIPESGSLKAKRQVLRRITDRVKARFNVSVAEVEDQDLWQRAGLALAVVSSDRRHAEEQLEKIIHFVEDMYVAPLVSRETETLGFGDELFASGQREDLPIASGQRSLAEAEGLGAWHERHQAAPARPERSGPSAHAVERPRSGSKPKKLSLDEARAKARSLRNPRDWEKP
jgi:uncharacterized protein YlxP (DUF503 family)